MIGDHSANGLAKELTNGGFNTLQAADVLRYYAPAPNRRGH